MLRQQYKTLMRRFFSREIRKYRLEWELTQEQLSERLCMAPRSYADLERGISGCSGLTVILFMVLLKDEEALRLIHEVRKELKGADRHDAA